MHQQNCIPAGAGTPALSLVPERNAVLVEGQEVSLTGPQFRILAVLCRAPGPVFGRAELVERAIEAVVSERTVDAHVKELRRKLGRHESLVETVHGAGYRFNGRVPRPE